MEGFNRIDNAVGRELAPSCFAGCAYRLNRNPADPDLAGRANQCGVAGCLWQVHTHHTIEAGSGATHFQQPEQGDPAMIRASLGDKRYWEERVANRWVSIEMAEEQLKKPSGAPTYRAEYVWGLTEDHPRQTLTQYSRGDAIGHLYNPYPKVLDAWEMSNREAEAIRRDHGLETCRDWDFQLSNLGKVCTTPAPEPRCETLTA